VTSSAHLRGIVIAGALAALALALGFVTMAMNQTASKAPHTILPLKDRHLAGQPAATTATTATMAKAKAKPVKRPNPNFVAALKAGLPHSVAEALASHQVVVVELMSPSDAVATLADGEAKAGATLAGAGFVAVNVDKDGGDASKLTIALGDLPAAPASLIYARPATLAITLPGFNDRTVVQQAAVTTLAAAKSGTVTPAQSTTTTSATPSSGSD
jgi:hypothetical protein